MSCGTKIGGSSWGAKHLVQQQWEKVVTLTQNIEEQHVWSFQWPESDGAWRLLSKKLEFEVYLRVRDEICEGYSRTSLLEIIFPPSGEARNRETVVEDFER